MSARVFLSCGQNRENEEARIAGFVAEKIREIGFECYIAVTEQSLLGLRENIFGQLESSDYFVFIDFKREKLDLGAESPYRGSLFSHQELAVASYLQIPALVFQESGVKQRDGMLGIVQGNATSFTDRQHLPSIVAEEIRRRLGRNEWRTDSTNGILVNVGEPVYTDAVQQNRDNQLRHFHLFATNNHFRKRALGCFAYLESIIDLRTSSPVPVLPIEFKWSGSTLPSVIIPPKASRRFDALFFQKTDPIELGFKIFADSTEFVPRLERSVRYKLTYSVASQTFETARKSVHFEFGRTLDSVIFQEV